ncbi:MAG: UDP-2,4-diacetamido-2,4,6-trideoxy-beta-L-altropyranose hydrolase [Myxococcales bacterium]
MIPVLIRLDANSSIGLGHLGRCLALSRALRRGGAQVTFGLSPFSSRDAFERLRGANEAVVSVPCAEAGGALDAQATREIARDLGARALILDGYHLRSQVLPAVRQPGVRLAYVDDVLSGAFDVDVFINPSLHGDHCQVSLPTGATALLGAAYSLIRAPFLEARSQRAKREPGANLRVLVSMGGTDPGGISLAVLRAFSGLAEPWRKRCDVSVLLSPNFHGWEEARHLVSLSDVRVALQTTVPELAPLLVDVDLAVVSASTTLAELSTVGVPAIAMATVDNQVPVAEAATRLGVARVVACDAEQITDAMTHLVKDGPGRERMAIRQREVVDGLGASRIADAILRGLENT